MEKLNLITAIQYALDGKAILFSGSGFSYGAKNVRGNHFPLGDGLRDLLANDLGRKTTLNLRGVAQTYQKRKGTQKLIELLNSTFTLLEATSDHEVIMSLPWKRVYTTNYDLLAETVSQKQGFPMTTITLSSAYNSPATKKACVHLNGAISNLTETTLMDEFRLTDSSYDAGELRGHSWFDFMEEDFKSAKAIFVVGYSKNSDLDVSRILALPVYKNKIIFINKQCMDELEKEILSPLGEVYEMGLDGFATEIGKVKKEYISSPLKGLKYYSFLYENMKPFETNNATMKDLTEFYFKGNVENVIFKQDRIGDYQYICPRNQLDIFLKKMKLKRVFIVVAALGNGKTVFCQMIRQEMRNQDMDVYTYQMDLVDIETEIGDICTKYKTKKCIVIIDDYNKHLNVIKKFADYGCENIIFLLTARRSAQETTYGKLMRILSLQSSQVMPLFLDSINSEEEKQMSLVLDNNNVFTLASLGIDNNNIKGIVEEFHQKCNDHIADIVLYLFDSSKIKSELINIFGNSMSVEDKKIYHLCILGLANSTLRLDLSFSDMLSLLDLDYLSLDDSIRSSAFGDIFDADKDKFSLVSSVISRKILYEIIDLNALTSVLTSVVKEADKRSGNKYMELIKAILSHNNYDRLIRKNKENVKVVIDFYEEIRSTIFCQKNPFYWEQYAIVCQKGKEYATAKQCLINAYVVARRIKGFIPFQIETIDGGLILEEALENLQLGNLDVASGINKLEEAHNLMVKHYNHPENNHIKAIQYAGQYSMIYNLLKNKMSRKELSRYINIANDMLQRMYEFRDTETYAITKTFNDNIEKIEKSLKNAKAAYK